MDNHKRISFLSLSSIIACTLLFSAMILAEEHTFEPPRIEGYRVDGCTLDHGDVDCDWGEKEAANAFCRTKGFRNAKHGKKHHYGDVDLGTYRWKIYRKQGQERVIWEYCEPCSMAFVYITCFRP